MITVDLTMLAHSSVMLPKERRPKKRHIKMISPQKNDSFTVGVSSRCLQTFLIHCATDDRSLSRNITLSDSNCRTAHLTERRQHNTVIVATVGKCNNARMYSPSIMARDIKTAPVTGMTLVPGDKVTPGIIGNMTNGIPTNSKGIR